jgi:hypothetical protein
MNVDVDRILTLLQETMLAELGDEVELIFRYGSTVRGATHQYSDLDVSFVPRHESTWNSVTVLIDNVMVDFYPIHWSRLEAMAGLDDVSGTLLSTAEILYQSDDAAADRFRGLAKTLASWLQPEKKPDMLRKAMDMFERTTYQYFLLTEQNDDNTVACVHHARNVHTQILQILAVCNQKSIDTRKREQVCGLPDLPDAFVALSEQIVSSTDGALLKDACGKLLSATRTLLVSQQRELHRSTRSIRESLDEAYPEFKGDLHHVMLACQRRDFFNLSATSLIHELMIHLSEATDGVAYSDFNGLSDYQKDLEAMGFPDLIEPVGGKDYNELFRRCKAFDSRLQSFHKEQDIPLYSYADVGEFEAYLRERAQRRTPTE